MLDRLLEKDLVPDILIRAGIRRLLAQRLREESATTREEEQRRLESFVAGLADMPIAINTAESRTQHYEVPTAFYQAVLGPNLKYSCCLFEKPGMTLGEAEEAMLSLYAQRARLANGQDILELGCGWGSLTLWMAEHFPKARITAVSHSRTQKEHIDLAATRRGLTNVTVITKDMCEFDAPAAAFDRVVSVEMFEHMKNWPRLFDSVSRWLRPEGLFFMHIFVHSKFAYHFVARDETDWMSRHFFTGGMMPALDMPMRIGDALAVREHWYLDGRHYQLTAEAWLANMDANKARLLPLFEKTYGKLEAEKWWAYWRIFMMSCAELWGYKNGREWGVGHYLLEKKQ